MNMAEPAPGVDSVAWLGVRPRRLSKNQVIALAQLSESYTPKWGSGCSSMHCTTAYSKYTNRPANRSTTDQV